MTEFEQVRELVKEYHVKFIRLQFTDILGALKNVAVTVEELERALAGQVLFDSAVFEGFRGYCEKDILLQPDPATFVVFPWRPRDGAVARLICNALTPRGEAFPGCSRSRLQKVISRFEKDGIRLMAGAEIEFFLFHSGEQGRPTTITHDQAGFCDLTPVDLGENARRDMVLTLEEMGIEVASSHHEMAPGQHEIGLKDDNILVLADKIATFKFVVRTVAQRHGLHASFMPKPLNNEAGSGLKLHLSLWRGETNLFESSDDPMGLSDTARYFIGGLLHHAGAVTALTCPLINSYKRFVPSYHSPFLAAWSSTSRNTMIRVPEKQVGDARITLRSPDPTVNPYLALAAILTAGMDGITNRIAPPPIITDGECSSGDELRELARERGLPRSLAAALDALEGDTLIKEMLGKAIYNRFREIKENEWERFLSVVHPWELEEYLRNY